MILSGEGERGLFWFYVGTFIDFILPVARRFYSPVGVGWEHFTNLDALILDENWYMSTIVQLLTILLAMHNIFSLDEIFTNANSDKIWNKSDDRAC